MALALVLVASVGAAQAAPDDEGDFKKRLKQLEKKERALLEELEGLDRDMDALEDRLVEIGQRTNQAADAVEAVRGELAQAEARASRLEKALGERLTVLYRLRGHGVLPILLRAHSLPDLVHRYRYLAVILDEDKKRLERLARQRKAVAESQAELLRRQRRLADLQAELERDKDRLRRLKREQTAMLIKVHAKKELYQAMIAARQRAKEQLMAETVRQEAEKKTDREPAWTEIKPFRMKKEEPPSSSVTVKIEKPEAGGGPAEQPAEPQARKRPPGKFPDFKKHKGRVPKPVDGRVVRPFGPAEGPFGTVIQNHGVAFAAEPGEKVHAVLEGQVHYIGWLKGYGNIIIVNHGRRYYTLTGGLVGIGHEVGDWVRQGDVLGRAPQGGGDNKNQIYFEIRHRGLAMDPAPWLGSKTAA